MAKAPTKKNQVASLGAFSREELSFLLENLDKMPLSEQEFLLRAIDGDVEADRVVENQENLLPFMKTMEPKYIYGAHHRKIAAVLEEVVRGDKTRVIINIAPRFGKSELASYLFPAWFIGKFPDKKIIIASHTAELATNFGRKVRNLMDTPEYRDIFPDVRLSVDSKAAGRWATNEGGEFFAAGVGGALAGRGGDLILIDDPVSEQMAKSGSTQAFIDQWEWFQQGLMTRLMPGGRLVVLMCMTGDTRVLMGDRSEKRLDSIVVGDTVATYDDGYLTTTKVLNFQSSGVDSILTVQTQSGIILRANERHPFLVDFEGERRWVRLKDLRVGMLLVATKDAVGQHDHKLSRDFAARARWCAHITRKTLMPPTARPDTTESTKEKHASLKDVLNQQKAKAIVPRTMQHSAGIVESDHLHTRKRKGVVAGLNIGTVLRRKVLTLCSRAKAVCARFVGSPRQYTTPERIGGSNYVSTTTTSQGGSGGCCATVATSQLDTQNLKKQPLPSQHTSPFTTDRIASITPSGREEVFDVQIDRTENFIANGVVSHNTRWSKLDLSGQILNHMAKNPDADQWEVIELPAVLPSGESLWPEFWPAEELEKKRISVGPAAWAAQYLQQPTSEGAQILKSEWWRNWDKDEPPECVYTVMSLDAAQEAHNRADYSAMTLWGVFYVDGADGRKMTNVILLNAWKDRLEFPDLKRAVLADYKEWKPDTFIVEKKSSGAALYQELRRMDIAVTEYTPVRGAAGSPQHKVARVNAISDMFASGMIWAPLDRRWAQEVVMECAEFPLGATDDFVDSASQALIRIRQGGFLTLPSDYEDNELPEFRRTSRSYY